MSYRQILNILFVFSALISLIVGVFEIVSEPLLIIILLGIIIVMGVFYIYQLKKPFKFKQLECEFIIDLIDEKGINANFVRRVSVIQGDQD